MSTSDFFLGPVPTSDRHRELWLQHVAGFILFEDMRGYAIDRLDPSLEETARKAALKAIDDTVYGLMMVLDGVSGSLANAQHAVRLQTKVCLESSSDELIALVDLFDGDGMSMGFHSWREGDFGEDPVAVLKQTPGWPAQPDGRQP
jgi:hypothetical protein